MSCILDRQLVGLCILRANVLKKIKNENNYQPYGIIITTIFKQREIF